MLKVDVLVIGSGGAGMRAALSALGSGVSVALMTKNVSHPLSHRDGSGRGKRRAVRRFFGYAPEACV